LTTRCARAPCRVGRRRRGAAAARAPRRDLGVVVHDPDPVARRWRGAVDGLGVAAGAAEVLGQADVVDARIVERPSAASTVGRAVVEALSTSTDAVDGWVCPRRRGGTPTSSAGAVVGDDCGGDALRHARRRPGCGPDATSFSNVESAWPDDLVHVQVLVAARRPTKVTSGSCSARAA
jgi:hypothetical protein